MSVLDEQRAAANAASAAKRQFIAQLRSHVLAGRVGLDALLLDPPPQIAHLALIDVMAFARPRARGSWRVDVGRAAVRAGVNVLQPVGGASKVSREWCVGACPRVSPKVAERRREVEARARARAASWGEVAA